MIRAFLLIVVLNAICLTGIYAIATYLLPASPEVVVEQNQEALLAKQKHLDEIIAKFDPSNQLPTSVNGLNPPLEFNGNATSANFQIFPIHSKYDLDSPYDMERNVFLLEDAMQWANNDSEMIMRDPAFARNLNMALNAPYVLLLEKTPYNLRSGIKESLQGVLVDLRTNKALMQISVPIDFDKEATYRNLAQQLSQATNGQVDFFNYLKSNFQYGPIVMLVACILYFPLALGTLITLFIGFPFQILEMFKDQNQEVEKDVWNLTKNATREYECPLSGEMTEELKQYRLPEGILFLGIAAMMRMEEVVGSPQAIRSRIVKNFFFNLPLGNFLTLMMLPTYILSYCRTFEPGTSARCFDEKVGVLA